MHAKCILSGWKLSAWRLQVWKLWHHHVKLKWWILCSSALQWELLQLRFFGAGWLGSTVTKSRKPIDLMSVWGCRVKLWGLRGIRARDGLPVQSHLQSLHFWMSSRIRARGGLLEHPYRDLLLCRFCNKRKVWGWTFKDWCFVSRKWCVRFPVWSCRFGGFNSEGCDTSTCSSDEAL